MVIYEGNEVIMRMKKSANNGFFSVSSAEYLRWSDEQMLVEKSGEIGAFSALEWDQNCRQTQMYGEL